MRLTVTRRSDLAIRVLRTLAEHGEPVRGDQLAVAVGTTRAFLAQVIGPLVCATWVRSAPGPRGGYWLAPMPDSVSVMEVIESVEGPLDLAQCVLERDRACRSGAGAMAPSCALHDPWLAASAALRSELERMPVVIGARGSTTVRRMP